MFKHMTAAVLSMSLAISTLSTTPARADEDVAKVLAGLVALGIIAKVIDDRNDRKVTRHAKPAPVVVQPKPVRKVAPNRCLRNQWTHRGNRQVYSAHCMRRHTDVRLPRDCRREVRTRDGENFRFFTPRCLRQHGWRA